jgi:hypothetical protein
MKHGVEVELPPLPDHLRYDWGPTNAALLIWCQRCKGASVLYTVTILRDPGVVARAVGDHLRCDGSDPGPALPK